jgi:hypothetical protein
MASLVLVPEGVRQRRAAESVHDGGESRPYLASTPVSSAFAARHIHNGQRCGKLTQHYARKPGSPATPPAAIAPLGQKLLCKVQRQICIYFSQLMNSF